MAEILTLNFESGVITGAGSFSSANAAWTVESVDPLVGDHSARLNNDGTGSGLDADAIPGTDMSSVYAAFYLRMRTRPSTTRTLFHMVATGEDYFASVRMLSDGRLRLYDGSTALATSNALELDEIYRIELERHRDSGVGDGILRFWLATGNGPATLIAERLVETTNKDVDFFRFTNGFDASMNYDIDEFAVDDSEMPALAPVVYPPTELEALTILEVHTRAYSDVTELEAVTILETAPQPAVMRQDHALRAVTFIETQTDAALSGEHNLRAVTILETFAQDQYSGPGTGLLTGDPATVDITELVNALRDGDSAPILTSWAGVDGISGILRVLKRSIDDSRQRQTIDEPFFIPLPDPSLPARQQGGSRIRTAPEQRGNVFRQVKNQQRKIDRGSRD